jgi:hypothetical protein
MARTKKVLTGDASLLAAALEGLELQKARIDEQIRSVKALMGGGAAKAPAAPKAAKAAPKRKKRQLSEEARARIAAAQKKRWANFRKAQKQAANE